MPRFRRTSQAPGDGPERGGIVQRRASCRLPSSLKIHVVRDTGLLHTLLTLETAEEVAGHPKVGASFEGFAVEQIANAFEAPGNYFWATHGGAELDLLVMRSGKRYGFECKLADAPGTTRPMQVALTTWTWITSGWCIPETRRIHWMTVYRCCRSPTSRISPDRSAWERSAAPVPDSTPSVQRQEVWPRFDRKSVRVITKNQ